MSQSAGFPALQGTQEGEKHLQSAAIRLQPLPRVSPKGPQDVKSTEHWPQIAWKWKWNHSVVSDWAAPWTVSYQAPLSMGFSRQEYWSGLPFPFPGDLPNPGIKPGSPALQADVYCLSHQGSPDSLDVYEWMISVNSVSCIFPYTAKH